MRLRALKCPKCGAPVQLRDGAESTVCEQCGSPVLRDVLDKEERKLARKYPNPTPLRLGMKGRFRGREYELIGRIVLGMREEGQEYRWDEFELLSEDGDVLWLEFDEGEWRLMESFVPLTPIGPEQIAALTPGASVALDQTHVTVQEKNQSTIRFIEGELTFAARVGDRRNYMDASAFNRRYVVEWTEDEIEFYRGRPLSHRDVLVAFNLRDELRALEHREKGQRSKKLFAAVCLGVSLLSFVGWGMSALSGRLISRHSTVVSSAMGSEGVRFGPITLDPALYVHRLVIRGDLREASAWVAGVMEAADGSELLGTQHDFWDESGTWYEEGQSGTWHEYDLRAHTDFLVKDRGPYYIRLYAEPDTPTTASQVIGYELYGGILYPTYFVWYAFITLALAILFFCLGSPETMKKIAEAAQSDD